MRIGTSRPSVRGPLPALQRRPSAYGANQAGCGWNSDLWRSACCNALLQAQIASLFQVGQFALDRGDVLLVLLQRGAQLFHATAVGCIGLQLARLQSLAQLQLAACLLGIARLAVDFVLQHLAANIVTTLLRAGTDTRKICRTQFWGCFSGRLAGGGQRCRRGRQCDALAALPVDVARSEEHTSE